MSNSFFLHSTRYFFKHQEKIINRNKEIKIISHKLFNLKLLNSILLCNLLKNLEINYKTNNFSNI